MSLSSFRSLVRRWSAANGKLDFWSCPMPEPKPHCGLDPDCLFVNWSDFEGTTQLQSEGLVECSRCNDSHAIWFGSERVEKMYRSRKGVTSEYPPSSAVYALVP